ncbi:MAG TPA: patatin-like phospholipase family protein [Steroidobacteraceae bacterium]|nr:patatin-like phospholipase family protein [Steroidobacteraceae bacterium]
MPALVLTGGGARAAYQVGVLKAVAELLPQQANPFRVVVGTSAGAVAAAVLAARAEHWHKAVDAIEHVWANFRTGQVFDVRRRRMLRTGMHWIISLLSGGTLLSAPRSLFDNTPLRALLHREVRWRGLGRSIRNGYVDALALCSTNYATGRSVAFFEGRSGFSEWSGHNHIGRRARLGLSHLMASLAVPLMFPPEQVEEDYYGDGAIRQMVPLAPAMHLGASRLLIVGMRDPGGGGVSERPSAPHAPPTPGQLAGFALDTMFTDQIYNDMEQIERVNQILRLDPTLLPGSRIVDKILFLAPSRDPRDIAIEHLASLPQSLRALLRVSGAGSTAGAQLASYLMFEGEYTRALIALGRRDTLARAAEVRELLVSP